MKKNKKIEKAPKPVFGVKQDGKERYFRFGVNSLNLSPYGVISAEDAMQKTELIKDLIDKKSFVLSEVSKSDYEAYEKSKQKEGEESSDVNMSTAYEERINKLESQLKELFDQKVTQSVVSSSVKVEAPVRNADDAKVPEGNDKKEASDADYDLLKKSYEELTGNKPGNKKAETLQKEIDEFNAKQK